MQDTSETSVGRVRASTTPCDKAASPFPQMQDTTRTRPGCIRTHADASGKCVNVTLELSSAVIGFKPKVTESNMHILNEVCVFTLS